MNIPLLALSGEKKFICQQKPYRRGLSGLGMAKVGIDLGSGEFYPNYPNSLGMFQAKALVSTKSFVSGINENCDLIYLESVFAEEDCESVYCWWLPQLLAALPC